MILREKLTFVPGQQSLAIKEQKNSFDTKLATERKKAETRFYYKLNDLHTIYLIFEVCRCCENVEQY